MAAMRYYYGQNSDKLFAYAGNDLKIDFIWKECVNYSGAPFSNPPLLFVWQSLPGVTHAFTVHRVSKGDISLFA